ncbi:MAG: translation initiation factor IF-3 [Gammaproteobacteria bacterium]
MKQGGKKKSFGAGRNKLNSEITHEQVRLIAEDGAQVGIVPIAEALDAAKRETLDLVEIAPDAEPPVCRLMNYGKHLFEEKKKRTESRKKQRQSQVKEVKIRPNTEDNDYQVKLRAVKRFLEAGDKAKVTLRFKGREMAHHQLGVQILRRMQGDLDGEATVEQEPKLEGRQVIMVLAPAKRR